MLVTPDLAPYAPYRLTSLEQEHRHEAPFDVLRMPMLDMTDLEVFKPGPNEYLAAEDEVLLRPADSQPSTVGGTVGGREGAVKGQRSEVTWLRRTEYLSTESNRPRGAAQRPQLSKETESETKLETKEGVISAIERSFQVKVEKDALKHPNNPNLKAVALYPILPPTESSDPFAQCTFDADPAQTSVDGVDVAPCGEQRAMLKAMSNANDPEDTFVWFYLPMTQPSEMSDEESERLVYARDYDIQRIDRQLGAPLYVLAVPGDDGEAANYTPIVGHFQLKKRRAKSDQTQLRHSLKINRIAE